MLLEIANCTRPEPLTAATAVLLPLVGARVVAGFPSPAEDFAITRLDIVETLIRHPQATYYAKASGRSMESHGIRDGDLLVIDKAVQARHGHIVVASVDGDFTVKQLCTRQGQMRLLAGNPTFPPIVPRDGQTFEFFGVVRAAVTLFLP